MRQLTIRLFVLAVMVGFLAFSSMSTSKAGSCNIPCYQSCYEQYRPCLSGGAQPFCCLAFNECIQECGDCIECEPPPWGER